MLQPPRLLVAAALTAGWAAAGWCAAYHDGLDRQKADRAATLYSVSAHTESAAAWGARAASAHALVALKTAHEPSHDCITLYTHGKPGSSIFTLGEGRKLAIDLSGTIDLSNRGAAVKPTALVTALRSNQYEVEPAFVTRVVIELSQACAYQLQEFDDRIQIVLTPTLDAKADHGTPSPVAENHVPAADIAQHLASLRDAAAASSDADADAAALAADTLAEQLAGLADAPSAPEAPRIQVARDQLANDLAAVANAKVNLYTNHSEATASLTDAKQIAQNAADQASAASAGTAPADGQAPAAPAPEAPAAPPADAPAPATPPADAPAAPVEPAAPATPAADTPPATEPPGPREAPPAPSVDAPAANADLISKIGKIANEEKANTAAPAAATAVPAGPAPAPKAVLGDPMEQLVELDFRETDLSQVVALLAHKAEANVIAGTELKGTVTANLRRVPLRQAIETVLRMNDLGLIQEEGIYRIVPYTEAVAAKRSNTVLTLKNAKAEDLQKVLQDLIKGTPEQVLTNIAADKDANVLIISGPAGRVGALVEMAERLDVSQPVLPTVTEAIKLNYADPTQMLANIQKMLSEKIGSASADVRARHIIVTDVPVAVENIRDLVKKLDVPVKQVAIDAMIVDATLEDQADTGVNWLIRSIRSQSKQQAALGTTDGAPNGRALGSLQNLGLSTAALAGNPLAGALNFGVLTKNIDWGGIVQAEVRNNKGRLVSNPVVVAIENQPARIDISQQIPYVEVKQTNAGGSQTNTEFKSIGTVLTVTPRVTHDDNILTDIQAKESGTNGTFNNIPIENKRELQTNLRVPNGRTIFIGGLRKQDQNTSIRKVPVLGDLPVVNLLFRNNNRNQKVNELLVFLTCNVLKDEEDLTPYQKSRLADGQNVEVHVDGQGALAHDAVYPAKENDPLWKWRRSH